MLTLSSNPDIHVLQEKSKAAVSQLVNTEVNSGSRKAVLASNYATRIRGRHSPLRNALCINN